MIMPFKLRQWLSKKQLESMKIDAHLESGLVMPLRSFANWWIFNEIFLLNEYDRAIELTLSLEGQKEINVIDCGANAGLFTMRMMDRFLVKKRNVKLNLWLIEAAPHLVKELQSKMKSIGNSNINIQILSGLVGKRTGTATFQLGKTDDVTNYVSEKPLLDWTTRGKIKQLSYVDLEKMIGEETSLDLIKVDIEGSEFDFIESYSSLLKRTRVLAVEFHHAFGDVHNAIDKLSEAGLDLVHTNKKADTRSSTLVFNRRVE